MIQNTESCTVWPINISMTETTFRLVPINKLIVAFRGTMKHYVTDGVVQCTMYSYGNQERNMI